MHSPAAQPSHGAIPPRQGLYDPSNEHDACGMGFVARLDGKPAHSVITDALHVLERLDHRGAVGAEENSGDGAGILMGVPDAFLRAQIAALPPEGSYAVGLVFLPGAHDGPQARSTAVAAVERLARDEGLRVVAWRDLPIDDSMIGPTARGCMPTFRHLVVTDRGGRAHGLALERMAYRLRRRAQHEAGVYMASLSTRTLVYKGMLTTGQLAGFFPDLSDERLATRVALVHSRFSTNTFPSWPLAQPFRMIAHNGEINTVRGNRNWIAAREGAMECPALGDLAPLTPVCTPGSSDSASFDEVFELLTLAGRSMPHAMAMLIPEAWDKHATMDPALRSFYEYCSTIMEPWDGPAAMVFTDGSQVGAVMDRNGLRPGRWTETKDGTIVLASETGVLPIEESNIRARGRLEPGTMFLVDLDSGRIVPDVDVKTALAHGAPYQQWLDEHLVRLEDLPAREHVGHSASSVLRRQQTFGYTHEDLSMLLAPMARTGAEAIGSMGTDTPIAVLSARPRLLFDYFSQLFAQVTNPPLDSYREELVTSLAAAIGPEPNLLADLPEHAHKLAIPFPVLSSDQLAQITHIGRARAGKGLRATKISGLFRVSGGQASLRERLSELCEQVDQAIEEGTSFIVLSDRESTAEMAPIPSLLLTSAIHHHLLRRRTRTKVGIVVEAGDVREVHHVALLIGYGAGAVNPYLAMESAEEMARTGQIDVDPQRAVDNVVRALGQGVLKVMSKMGISTVASYRGAQVFQAVGLSQGLVDEFFTGTSSPLGGVGLDVIAEEVLRRHRLAYPPSGIAPAHRTLDTGGDYQWRREGEEHLFNPATIARLQHATRTEQREVFRRYTDEINDASTRLMTLRGLMRLRTEDVEPVALEEVEPVDSIVTRFATGAMSYGSISKEAHETLAIAMNRLGGKSNTGEGGEMPERLRDPQRCSKIKQVASGRFGVTAEYLSFAEDIQIKMAQGAKPGEGGQLPAHKVYPWVAQARRSTPGVGLVSPPPHHDIYSIEDLAQLISDLKNANERARIHVKLVSEIGVGTVAAGVAKAKADVVLISGFDGGTGAAPLTSIKHAGAPWEIGLAEAQQTLVLNDLRDRIVVQCDGQLKTGRDVVIAALLGAEEFGFATTALVVSGCIMMRKCHLDTCPVGVATQNPVLRERFDARPEFLITFFTYIAEEVRELLASLGLRSIEEAVGRTDLLDTARAIEHWKASGLDLTDTLTMAQPQPGSALHQVRAQDHGLDAVLDRTLIKQAAPALRQGAHVTLTHPVSNTDRSVGTMLGHEIAALHGDHGLDPHTIEIKLTGSAGQSLGAFMPQGVSIHLTGDANDYVGKSLCGGRISVAPGPEAGFVAEDNVIAGNVIGYGATAGELFIRGRVGERFGVRNSGATLVAEGAGDHALEYMTGGTVVILGATGRNVAAGMSGGTAYLLDLDPALVNTEALASGAIELGPPEPADLDVLQTIMRTHAELTGSAVASRLLADGELASRFTRVLPRHYAAVRRILAQAQSQGMTPSDPAVWQSILEVSRG
ncbi:glutamate synthase large subunit [Actinomyces slackii]|uniref:Ferredoxin-dependent glutamate synthase 1 n=1 Tax=Actinomyces slackii TaxID=52774 RepID=A0A3S4WKW4_9ACTO|nr:glutamate synthase large subunit [Actinomyces slackii]VEG75124.1 Ferredoxin-dependent glutamate synthase 1 [Actinomyces slackii]